MSEFPFSGRPACSFHCRWAVRAAAAICILTHSVQAADVDTNMTAALASPYEFGTDADKLPRSSWAEILTLGPGDRLTVWVHLRQDLSGELRVRTDGTILVPILGAVVAEGRTILELEHDLTRALERSGNVAPLVSVDVTEWRPIFVVGTVDKPGLFAFRPGMTALQALALAGGIYRPPASSAALEASRERWQLRQTRGKLKLALARQARLEAERRNENTIRIPDALAKMCEPGEAELLIRAEQALMEQRKRAFETLIASHKRSAELAEVELAALRGELEQVHQQIRLAEDDLEQVSDLVKSGLTTQVRVNELRRSAASLEGEKRRIQGNIARTQQTMNVSSRERGQTEFDRAMKIEEDLRTTQEEIRALEVAALAAEDVVYYLTGGSMRNEAALREPALSYTVTRTENGRTISRQITEKTELRPGDTIRVSLAGRR